MTKLKKLDLSKGFTLVELLVVISIIGVLSSLVLLQLGTARAKARDAKRIADVNQLRAAIELFLDDNSGTYPLTLTSGAGGTLAPYLSSAVIPTDPVTGNRYFYSYTPAASPTRFHLWTELERTNQGALRADGDINSSTWTSATGHPAGSNFDASPASTETCTAAYAAGAARDCVYDTGQN